MPCFNCKQTCLLFHKNNSTLASSYQDCQKCVKNIILSMNDIQEFPNSIFDYYKHADSMYIVNNSHLRSFGKTFIGAIKLRTLFISENQICQLTNADLIGAENLEILSLRNNQLEHVEPDVFKFLVKILNLNLAVNKLTTISDNLFTSLEIVEEIDLSENRIKTITTSMFRNNSNLKILRLANNNIETIQPKSLNSIKKLEELYLNGNNLISFNEIGPSLILLNLDFNRISQLSIEGSVKKISAANNQICKIQVKSKSVKELNLQYNLIADIGNITKCKNLVKLDITFNPISIKRRSSVFAILRNLKYFYLQYDVYEPNVRFHKN